MTRQQPDALMSYTRFDDEQNGAALTTFCKKLSGEVRSHTGQPFYIFQDLEDIKWGQQFQQHIDRALETITFFIPILTPSFFNSKFCRYELEKFLEREKHLGRNDLILPVYYIRVPALEETALYMQDPLAQIIINRQRMDWRELRFEPFDSPNVRRMLAEMAEQIAEALKGRVPLVSPPPVSTPLPTVPMHQMQPTPPPDVSVIHPATSESQHTIKATVVPPHKPEWEPQHETNEAILPPQNNAATIQVSTAKTLNHLPRNLSMILVMVALPLLVAFVVFAIRERSTRGVAIIPTTPHVTATSTPTPTATPLPDWVPRLIEIPAGTFMMGRGDNERQQCLYPEPLEIPQFAQELPKYSISMTEVTNAQFRSFVDSDGYTNPEYWTESGWNWRKEEDIFHPEFWDNTQWNSDEQPVVGISWYEAVAYARWLSAQTGHDFRLPTEAEWEKAARGPNGLIWPWGDEWSTGRANSIEAGINKTMPVGSYSNGASPYGVLDMAGNVWEWTATIWKGTDSYQVEDEWSEAYLAQDGGRVYRGGGFRSDQTWVRNACRTNDNPYNRYNNRGLRLASDSPPPGSTE